MSKKTLRLLAAAGFVLLAVLGLLLPTGWGSASGFGIREIALLCPVGALEVMLAEKTLIPRALLALAAVVVITILLGRVFCGWVCPVPWLQGALRKRRPTRPADAVNDRSSAVLGPDSPTAPAESSTECRSACAACTNHSGCAACAEHRSDAPDEPARASKTPFVILGGALASSAAFGFPVFCLVCPVGLVFAVLVGLWRLFVSNDPDTALLFFIGILGLEMIFLRRWCSNFCPIGALFSIISRWNRRLRPTPSSACVKASEGVACTRCRDACPEDLDPSTLRQDDPAWSRCTKCGACQAACLANAIRFPWKGPAVAAASRSPSVRAEPSDACAASESRRFTSKDALAGCSHCAQCRHHCPQGSAMPEAIAAAARGDDKAARAALLAPGRLPEICARLCPSPSLCESACAHGVPIAKLEAALADAALAEGWTPSPRRAPLTKRVAVVGSGPAGLACADALARSGVWVDVYEKRGAAGGLLAGAIPAWKLPREVLEQRIALMQAEGVRFILGTEIGRDKPWSALLDEYDAVFAALGAGPEVRPDMPVADGCAGRMIQALELLEDRACGRAAIAPLTGKRVVVLGGGDTALDVVRTAMLENAAEVLMAARAPKARLRANPQELDRALAGGLRLLDNTLVNAVREAGGRLELAIERDGEQSSLEADVVVTAYGQRRDSAEDFAGIGLRISDDGKRAEALPGSSPRVWAGGDFTRGASLVVNAVADGREAARRIGEALGLRLRLDRE